MENKKEWRITKRETPEEIVSLINSVFCLYEIRAQVGRERGIVFIVHTNEGNHAIPHVHAEYGEFNVSISLIDQAILAGNIPKKQSELAQNWVSAHKDELLTKWSNISLSAVSHLTKSKLEMR